MKSLSLSQPHMIIMVGLPGSGKSFFAEKFANTFVAPYVSQAMITSLTGANDKASTDAALYQIDELLKTQKSIIIDGIGDTRTERAELTKRARKAGYETLFVWVQTDPITAKSRSTKPSKERHSPAISADEHERRVKRFTPLGAIEKPIVISGKHTYASQAKVVLKKLSAPRAEKTVASVETPQRTAPVRPRRSITIR